jgi:hypothetical protein
MNSRQVTSADKSFYEVNVIATYPAVVLVQGAQALGLAFVADLLREKVVRCASASGSNR